MSGRDSPQLLILWYKWRSESGKARVKLCLVLQSPLNSAQGSVLCFVVLLGPGQGTCFRPLSQELGAVMLVGSHSLSCQILVQLLRLWAVFFVIRNKIHAARWDPAACQSVTGWLWPFLTSYSRVAFLNRFQRFVVLTAALWVSGSVFFEILWGFFWGLFQQWLKFSKASKWFNKFIGMCENKTKEDLRAVFSLNIFLLLPVHIPHVIKGRPKAIFGTSWSHLQVYHLQAWPGLAFLKMVQHLHGLRDAQETVRQTQRCGWPWL